MENSSFRQAGKEVSGKIYRGSVVDANNRSSQSIIPPKSESALSISLKKEAFGSSASRFSYKSAKLPGPGSYSESATENHSLSKKGYGGLTSSAPRFKKFQYVSKNPGPGSYDYKPSSAPSIKITSSHTKSLKKYTDLPAPGQYEPLLPQSCKEATSMFKSRSKRLETPEKNSPAPWQYSPSYNLTRSSSSMLTSAFKMPVNARRHQINLYDPHSIVVSGITPGPGEYDVESKEGVARPSSMFAVGEKDRFGRSSNPKVVDIIPGPGYYQIQGEVVKAEVTGAVFMSDSERRCFSIGRKQPGPAFYKPMYQPKKKSFHLKQGNMWV